MLRDKQADEVVAKECGPKECIFMLESLKSIIKNIKEFQIKDLEERLDHIKKLYNIS